MRNPVLQSYWLGPVLLLQCLWEWTSTLSTVINAQSKIHNVSMPASDIYGSFNLPYFHILPSNKIQRPFHSIHSNTMLCILRCDEIKTIAWHIAHKKCKQNQRMDQQNQHGSPVHGSRCLLTQGNKDSFDIGFISLTHWVDLSKLWNTSQGAIPDTKNLWGAPTYTNLKLRYITKPTFDGFQCLDKLPHKAHWCSNNTALRECNMS